MTFRLNGGWDVKVQRNRKQKSYIFQFFGPPTLVGRVLWNRVCPSFRPSFCQSLRPSFRLSRRFLGIVSLVFSKCWHGARNPYEVVRDRAGFSRKKFFAPKIGKMDQKWAKTWFFEFIEKFCHSFLLNLFYNENLYYMCSCTNPIFGKIFVHEICAKSANQIADLINHISRANQWNSLIFCMFIQIHIN